MHCDMTFILTASRKTVSKLPEIVSWPSMLVCIVFATLALFCKEQGITVLVNINKYWFNAYLHPFK